MTKTLTGYGVLVCQYILNDVIFAFKMSLLGKRHLMTVVINMYKPYFIFKTCVMVMNVSCQSYAHPFN